MVSIRSLRNSEAPAPQEAEIKARRRQSRILQTFHPALPVWFQSKISATPSGPPALTGYLEAGGTLDNAQAMAAHESARTTKLHDRTGDEITLDEVERIAI